MATKGDVTGAIMTARFSLEQLQKMDEFCKTLSHILLINSQVMNEMLEDCPPQVLIYMKEFIIGHNKQVNSINFLAQELNKAFYNILDEMGVN